MVFIFFLFAHLLPNSRTFLIPRPGKRVLTSLDYLGIHEHIILILKSCRSQHYILHISIMRAGLLISLSHMP
ncbi:hypothetical protein BJX65DRAFT_272310 [Aspergillus insuetus]